jgi:hypothetical protein
MRGLQLEFPRRLSDAPVIRLLRSPGCQPEDREAAGMNLIRKLAVVIVCLVAPVPPINSSVLILLDFLAESDSV